MDAFTRAATNRSIRTIQTELDFLLDASILTAAQVSQITAILPANASSASAAPPQQPARQPSHYQPTPPPAAAAVAPSPPPPPAAEPISEKQAPPSYGSAAAGGGIASAEALYDYQPTDAGDLALRPGERVVVLEWMNADWARGRNERSGSEGIFPRSYVRVVDDAALKGVGAKFAGLGLGNSHAQNNTGYGNAPVEVANGQQQQGGEASGKVNAQGKKFGKKLGNAAIFGAGATIGSNIVNGIF